MGAEILVSVLVAGLLSAGILIAGKRVLKRTAAYVLLWIVMLPLVITKTVNLAAKSWRCSGGVGCVGAGIGLALLLLIVSTLAYIAAGLVLFAVKRFRK